MLEREEYVEQAYFFRALLERMEENTSVQDLMVAIREEILATTNLPKAIDFLAAELKLSGAMSRAMVLLPHYFTPFQSYVVAEAERETGRFDIRTAWELLAREANFRANGATPQALFVYEFEALSRNRLGYDKGLEAMSRDPIFNEAWREWILAVRRQVGLVDFAEMLYVRSEFFVKQRKAQGVGDDEPLPAILFGEKEGRIALAHRRKDPLLLFAALQRHLNYPTVPRPARPDEQKHVVPLLIRRVERLEQRLKLVEEEQRGGIDLSKFMPRDRRQETGDRRQPDDDL
jgi:hypothetical protein